jgi:hypothetical protein
MNLEELKTAYFSLRIESIKLNLCESPSSSLGGVTDFQLSEKTE